MLCRVWGGKNSLRRPPAFYWWFSHYSAGFYYLKNVPLAVVRISLLPLLKSQVITSLLPLLKPQALRTSLKAVGPVEQQCRVTHWSETLASSRSSLWSPQVVHAVFTTSVGRIYNLNIFNLTLDTNKQNWFNEWHQIDLFIAGFCSIFYFPLVLIDLKFNT